jgi:hypothetical protein
MESSVGWRSSRDIITGVNLCVFAFIPQGNGATIPGSHSITSIIGIPRLCRIVHVVVVFGTTLPAAGSGGMALKDALRRCSAPLAESMDSRRLPPRASGSPSFLPVFPKTTVQPGTNSTGARRVYLDLTMKHSPFFPWE